MSTARSGRVRCNDQQDARPRAAARLGCPSFTLIDDIENVLLVTGVTPPTLDQIAMASFIEDAALERPPAVRRRYRAKRDILVDALGKHLPDVRISGAAAGLHLLAWLPDGTQEHATAMRARRSGVGVHELHRHCTTHAPSPRHSCSATGCWVSPT
jgi:DNA-binding transcriptional MocR family regulator